MLRTLDQARMLTPWEEPGSNVYAYAELLVNHSWFYVDCWVLWSIVTSQNGLS